MPLTVKDTDVITVTFTVTARRRWIKQLAGLFAHMQKLGSWGSSRMLHFYADGDGDFRPKFAFADSEVTPATPIRDNDGEATFDAR